MARYVTLSESKPESPAVSRLEAELGLTLAAMLRMRLVVEVAEETSTTVEHDHYQHLKAVG